MNSAKIKFDAGVFFTNINKEFFKDFTKEVAPQVTDTIKKGTSPVRGAGKYKKYSPSYQKQIGAGKFRSYSKNIRPINLTLSGKMLRSVKVRSLKRGGVSIRFSDPKVKYHNEKGAGRSKTIRPMLPNKHGQEFNRPLSKQIELSLERSMKKVLRK